MRYRVETHGLRSSAFLLKHVVVIGSRALVEATLEKLKHTPELGLFAVGALLPASDGSGAVQGAPLLGHYEVGANIVRRAQVHEVLVACEGGGAPAGELGVLVSALRAANVLVHLVPCFELGSRRPAESDAAREADSTLSIRTRPLLAD